MLSFRVVPRYGLLWAISLALLAGLLPLFVFGRSAFGAGTLPNGFEQTRFVEGLQSPTAMEFAPDGRLFVAEKAGRLRVVTPQGELLEAPFVDVSGRVNDAGERGLLGVAFDPNFAANRYVYVYYTRKDDGPLHNVVARFTADADNPDVAEPGSETTVFELPRLKETNHNGGAIHFGTDGKLYVAVGENRREKAAPSLDSLLGKMLRINADGSIPEDNPFYDRTNGDNRAIWARGLRNPFTFAVQPGTGRIFINDVGQQRWEEINAGEPGANYGWPRYEGPKSGGTDGPLFAYRHGFSETTGQAITGGAFYDPPQGAASPFPSEYAGDYFFADVASGWIRRLDFTDPGDPEQFTAKSFKGGSNEGPVDIKVGAYGDLYFLARGTNSVERIGYSSP